MFARGFITGIKALQGGIIFHRFNMEKTSKKQLAKERLFGGGSDEIWVTFLDANGRITTLPKEQFLEISKNQPWKIKKL